MSGYRGFFKELARTRSAHSLWLQLRGGLGHVLRGWTRRDSGRGIDQFLNHYGAEGFGFPEATRRELASAAGRCLVCGLCSAECARIGATPPLDPQEAVVALSRLGSEAKRFGLTISSETPCGSCRACHTVCPVAIPIADVMVQLHDGN